MKKLLLITLFLFSSRAYSQLFIIKGIVKNKLTQEKLSFANIRILGTTTGTSANSEGEFELRLIKGKYKLITSYIGYKSDTTLVTLEKNESLEILLEPITIELSEITVKPGFNPAFEIIEKSIIYRKEREVKLSSYTFEAYTKLLIKTTKDLYANDNSVGLSIGEKDTGKLKITIITENQSKGYYKRPNKYKEEILARKQTANTPSAVNILTGGRLVQNFFSNDIKFFNRPIPTPISDEALLFYNYTIRDTLAIDNHIVYKIYFQPVDTTLPGLYGDIYIIDEIFAPLKINAYLNDASITAKIFDKVNVIQQFAAYDNNIYMPVDYRIFVEGNIFGLVKFGFDINSVFYNYVINRNIDDNIFDMALIRVHPDADKKDSLYWKENQTIPNTLEELKAYKRIDSLVNVKRSFWESNSFFNSRWYFSNNISVTAPLSIYSFNKVTGHQINFGFFIDEELDERFDSQFNISYGFGDKKIKTDFFFKYSFGEYHTGKFSLNIFNRVADIFGKNIQYNNLTSTVLSLLTKYDFRDYYYTKGWTFNLYGEIFPFLVFGFGFINQSDNSAVNNSDFSFFYKSRKYSINKKVYETKINAFTLNLNIDIRKYIENGYIRQRINRGEIFNNINAEIIISNRTLLKSSEDFRLYTLGISGIVPGFKSTRLIYNIENIFSEEAIPYQMMYALSGNIKNVGKSLTFRTIRLGEVFGDRGFILNTQYDFKDEIFRLLKISFLRRLHLALSCHFNAALITISDKSRTILMHPYQEFKSLFYEVGFGIGHSLIPLSIEFTWKLNYHNKNNFVIGLNAILL